MYVFIYIYIYIHTHTHIHIHIYIYIHIHIQVRSASVRDAATLTDSKMVSSLNFSIFACHPCAGAMLIFSVSFQS